MSAYWDSATTKVKIDANGPFMPYIYLPGYEAELDHPFVFSPYSYIKLFTLNFDSFEGPDNQPIQFTLDDSDPYFPVLYAENIPAGSYIIGILNADLESAVTIHYYDPTQGGYVTGNYTSTYDVWMDIYDSGYTTVYWGTKFGGFVALGTDNFVSPRVWSFPQDVARLELKFEEIPGTVMQYEVKDVPAYKDSAVFINSGDTQILDTNNPYWFIGTEKESLPGYLEGLFVIGSEAYMGAVSGGNDWGGYWYDSDETKKLAFDVDVQALSATMATKVESTSINTIWKGTQNEYDALTNSGATADSSTLYVIL